MFKNAIGLALSVGGAIIGGKIISNLADKNPKTKGNYSPQKIYKKWTLPTV